MEYLFVISGAFAALFLMVLISKTKKQFEHWFLAIIFFLITINSLYVFNFYRSSSFYYVPFFSELNYAIPLLYGPLLWFYTKALTRSDYRFKNIEYWHFAPFIIFLLILLSPILTDYKLINSKHVGYPFIKLIISPFYLIAVLLILKNYRKRLLDQYAYDLKVKLLWLSWITLGAIALWILAMLGYLYNSFNDSPKTLLYDYYVLSFLAAYLFVLAYLAFTQTDLFHKKKEDVVPKKLELNKVKEEQNRKVNIENEDLARLKKIMLEKKPYLDPFLSINKLSEISNLPQYKISKILNTVLNQNFYDFVNGYRVEEVKRKLEEGLSDNYSILGIASDSGFNSKASFNRVFKKMAKMTPSQFLKQISEKE